MLFRSTLITLFISLSFIIVSGALINQKNWARVLYIYLMLMWFMIGLSIYLESPMMKVDQLFITFLLLHILPVGFTVNYLFSPSVRARFLSPASITGKRILVIDDDKGFCRMMKANLTSKGFDVLTATTGEKGIDVARRTKPDLILLDVILPGIKGREVCSRLKNNPKTETIPVIFLTAKDSPDDVKAEMEVGGVTHITKPLDFKHLMEEINKVIGNVLKTE